MSARIFRGLAAAFAVCCLTALHSPTAAQTAPTRNELTTRVDEYMQASVRFDQFSGSILIARDGVPLVSRGYGMANYELSVANTPDTVFRIGSLTKQFTSMAIMQLVQQRRLAVADPICNYLDNCPEAWRPITIRQLLTHTSGIPNFTSLPDWDENLSRQPYTQASLVNVFRDRPLDFAPGENFRYSNSGYYLLGLIIERVSGQTYADYIETNIFTPLGMTRSGYDDSTSIVPNRADGYDWSANAYANAEDINMMLPYAGGGLYSTTGDLLLWDEALNSNRLLPRRALEEVFTPVRNTYAYGWRIDEAFGHRRYGHSGSVSGFSAFNMIFPTERVAIIVLSNSDRTSATKVANALAAITFGQSYEMPRAQLFDMLWTTIQQQDVQHAIAQYRELRASQPDAYDYGEDTLNDLGYDLLENGRGQDAVAIFTLYTETFPEDGNAFDSLGEAYMRTGNRDRAIANYQRSLQLDPENANAERMLAELRTTP